MVPNKSSLSYDYDSVIQEIMNESSSVAVSSNFLGESKILKKSSLIQTNISDNDSPIGSVGSAKPIIKYFTPKAILKGNDSLEKNLNKQKCK